MLNNSSLQKNIGYFFNDEKLLTLALTHPSYANENNLNKCDTNQRLEFLGDAVLEFISSDFLYNYYSSYDEGHLTKSRSILVKEETLSVIARKLELYKYLFLGKGENENSTMHNPSIMCDAIEALIGAIYLDGGIEKARDFVNKYILNENNLHINNSDYKSMIQERANSDKVNIEYVLVGENGPDHDKTFKIELLYGDKIKTYGIGKSKKEAEQKAAMNALKSFN